MRHLQSGISAVDNPREAAGRKKRGITPFSPFRASLSSRLDPCFHQTPNASQATRKKRAKAIDKPQNRGDHKRKGAGGADARRLSIREQRDEGLQVHPAQYYSAVLHRRACSENISSAGPCRLQEIAASLGIPAASGPSQWDDSSRTMLGFSSSHAYCAPGKRGNQLERKDREIMKRLSVHTAVLIRI
jgi:hypothetical protein